MGLRFGGIQNKATEKSKKAVTAADKTELGRKYLTELNYTEAVASFTEAIGLDPENIPAYMGRAEVNELTTANETAWADVSEAENGAVTAEALTAAAPHCGRDRCGIPEQALCLLRQPRKPQP